MLGTYIIALANVLDYCIIGGKKKKALSKLPIKNISRAAF